MRYRMIGIDLDGTLLDRYGQVSQANRDAIAAAQREGVLVVPCTGRAWNEARWLVEQVPGLTEGVFVTGAAINDIATGETLDHAPLAPGIAMELVEILCEMPEAVLVFREVSRAGHNYLVTGRGMVSTNTRWWFEFTGAVVHHQPEVGEADLHHALRVGIVAGAGRMSHAVSAVEGRMRDRVFMHAFQAVQMPDPQESVHILEIFAQGVDKWRGLKWIAARHGIAPDEIAVIGDEINDVSMLRSAGCGIAMANATEPARAVADFVTRHRDDSGVAYAIEQLLSESWG